ncbi:MAG: zinc ABC transporter substrate-binding protein [Sedimentisphaerales bacterium]|nr:zinc ABC transporter substrate-binding protein [Sedimentisphaerales bacterium]
MKYFLGLFISIIAVFLPLTCGGCRKTDNPAGPAPEIAVANSYLHAAMLDLCGDETPVLSLTPPGMCPGHFDLTPGLAQQLRQCQTLIVFDFQKKLIDDIPAGDNFNVIIITPGEGLCRPETYLAVVKDIAENLSHASPANTEYYQIRREKIKTRLQLLQNRLHALIQDHGLKQTPVLCSEHQLKFVDWLGLEAADTFTGRDSATLADMDACITRARQKKVRLVIANLQEGTDLAQTLARELNVPVIAFNNFPDPQQDNQAFDHCLEQNVNALVEALKD